MLLIHGRINSDHYHEARDDERKGYEGDEEDGAPARGEFAADDPIL